MRQIGTLPSETEARKFVDYALTQDIRMNVEAEGDLWAIWVFDEDQIPKAKEELESFRQNPGSEKYNKAKAEADALRQREIKKHREAKKKVVKANQAWSQSFLQRSPVTITLIVMSVAAVMITTNPDKPLDFGSRVEPGRTWLSLAPIRESEQAGYLTFPRHTFGAIFQGEVWRLFTPMFLHFGLLHLLFNMMWLRDLGGVIEARRGRWRYLALVLLIAGISNAAQGIMKGPNFGGMSGVVFGLFGYVWMQSRYVPTSGFFMPQNIVILMLIWMAVCYSGIVGPIANTAHTVGLLTGMIIGYAPKLWRDLSR
jgi:GlpG protein